MKKTTLQNTNIEKTMHYNNEIELIFNSVKHHYVVNGKTVDGVTSVLGIIAKPALVYWSANKAAEYINLNLPVGKSIDEIEKLKLVNGCKTAHRTLKEEAADAGRLFHAWAESYIKKENPETPTNPMLAKAVEQFLTWEKEKNVKFIFSEKRVYSRKYDYCGTFDFLAEINGKLVLADIKTSTGIWDEYWLQTAAYKLALQEEFPETKVSHSLIIRCGKDGSFEIQEMNDFEKNANAFLGALILYRRMKEMKFINNNK